MPKGGKREGAGRKPLPPDQRRNPVTLMMDEHEERVIRAVLELLRRPRPHEVQP